MAEDETRLSNKLVVFRQIGGNIQVLDFIDWIRTKKTALFGRPHLDIVLKCIVNYFYLYDGFLPFSLPGDIWRPPMADTGIRGLNYVGL